MTSANVNIRFAQENDCALLLDFIKKLALYEKRLESVIATEENIYDIVFKRNIGHAIKN